MNLPSVANPPQQSADEFSPKAILCVSRMFINGIHLNVAEYGSSKLYSTIFALVLSFPWIRNALRLVIISMKESIFVL